MENYETQRYAVIRNASDYSVIDKQSRHRIVVRLLGMKAAHREAQRLNAEHRARA